MVRALKVFGRSFVRFYDELFLLVGVNLIWVIGSFFVAWGLLFLLHWPLQLVIGPVAALLTLWPPVPFPPTIFSWVLMAFLTLAPNPLTVGVYYIARRIVRERRVYFSDLWAGARRYFWRSWGLLAIGVAGYLLLLANLRFYGGMNTLLKSVAIIWLYGLLIWTGMQLYAVALLLEQRDKGLLLIVRNSFLLTASDPLFTLTLLLLVGILMVVGALLPFILVCFLGSLIGLISNAAVQERLAQVRKIRGEAEPPEEEDLA